MKGFGLDFRVPGCRATRGPRVLLAGFLLAVMPWSIPAQAFQGLPFPGGDSRSDTALDGSRSAPPEIPPAFQDGVPGPAGTRASREVQGPVARLTRHPLALEPESGARQDAPGPPVLRAPHRTVLEQPSEMDAPGAGQFQWRDTDLVQPPRAENRINPDWYGSPEQMSRDQFWQQFSKLPPDDPRARHEGYDSLRAILNNGFWFAGVDMLYLEPIYQGNNAFSRDGGSTRSAEHVDFGFDVSFRGYLGFETNAGPAIKFSFTRLNEFSALNEFVFTPAESALTSIDLGSSDRSLAFAAAAGPGSRLTLRQQLKIYSSEVTLYKDMKNPISRVRGNIGLRHVSLQQKLLAGLDDPAGGSAVARNFNDYFGMGPKLGLEYFRPIGHANLELQSGMFASLLFGRRDQILDVSGGTPFQFRQLGKIEPLTIFEAYLAVQWNIRVADCQHVYFRTALESQLWNGSDSALDIGDDLGLYGMTFGFGVKR